MRSAFLISVLMLASVAAASDAFDSLIFTDGLDRSKADFAGQSVAIIPFNGKC